MNLQDINVNHNATITCLSGNCDNLRDLGFCEKLKITKLQQGRNIVCMLCGTKVAISNDLAQKIIVEEDSIDL